MEISKSPLTLSSQLVPLQSGGSERLAARRRFEEEVAAPLRDDTGSRQQEVAEPYHPGEATERETSVDYGELIRRARVQSAAERVKDVNAEPPPPATRRAISAYLSQAQSAYDGSELMPRIDRYV